MAVAGPAAAGVEWTIEQTGNSGDPQQPVAITFTVSVDLTRIAGPDGTILIDYHDSRIYRLDPLGHYCRIYPFGRPHPDLPTASITIAAPATTPDRRHVSFGLQPALAQTAAVEVPQYWGQQFPFATAEYRISRDYTEINELFTIAGQHRRVFKQYPLLRRIDPVGLIDLLEGFPVSASIVSPAGRNTVTMHAPPRVTDALPKLPPPGACVVPE